GAARPGPGVGTPARGVPGVVAGACLRSPQRGRGPLPAALGHHRPRRLHKFYEGGAHRRGRAGPARRDEQAAALPAGERRQPGRDRHPGLARPPRRGLRGEELGPSALAKAVLWQPRDRDRAHRIGTAVVVPVATFFVVLYGAPIWVLDQVSGGRLDTS